MSNVQRPFTLEVLDFGLWTLDFGRRSLSFEELNLNSLNIF